ncbi:sigma-70 family RNA polymerase sigma factor [Luteolibacter sp. LG18]|uniref:RNA polymerase sigma factor n=1 Tax=Luteolibacter sp. LG18 TaxID=2819286 RepID=UPI002B2A107F|nr:RNA polymerase sigma factor [Luteolibacter sp. LG18]
MLSAGVATLPQIAMADTDTPSLPAEESLDAVLMARAGNGDHAAFRQIVERHQHAVVGTVAKMLGDPAEAEDIAQQVFLRLWRHAKRYRPEAKFTTYLFTIARNLVFNESRRRGRRKEVSVEEREDSANFHLPAPTEREPDSALLQGELQAAVDKAIQSLPEAQRVAVILRRYEQMPYEEIAKVLELTVPAIKSLLFRARTTLREALRDYLDD